MKQVRQCKAMLVAAVLLLLGSAGAVAQEYQPFAPTGIETDLQLFAPAELGSFGQRPAPHEGYFFTFEKLNWNIGGVKTALGDESVILIAPVYFPGGPIDPSAIPNTFDVSLPKARFGWGERYELGYMEDDSGWLAGVLHGPSDAQELIIGDAADADPTTQSVIINFSDPFNLMVGFVDLRSNAPGTDPNDQDRGGDGIIDDIDGDQRHGPDGLDTDGDGEPDIEDGITDFDDLVQLKATWDTVAVRTLTKFSGVEVMKMHRFNPFHGGTYFELHYGARFLQFDDSFNVDATGSDTTTMGDSYWNTQVVNNMVGPQVTGRWVSTRGRWTVNVQGRFMAAVNIQNADITGQLGSISTPSAPNRGLYFDNTSFVHDRREINFSPLAELRVQTSFQITRSLAASVGYTAMYTGNVSRASQVIEYRFPDMGLLEGGNADLFTNGVNFGVEFNR